MQGLVLKVAMLCNYYSAMALIGGLLTCFSMEREFSEKDFDRLTRVFRKVLNKEFAQIGFKWLMM
ncbi:hypothetical protein NXV08_00155 (plasmid) [Bacteroides fragilis]|nr:hypothetical protein [Bacteroides fragilis]